MKIVDASVAAKWLMKESDSELALELLESGEALLAPAIILTEVAGAIVRRVRHNELCEATARNVYESWRLVVERGLISLVPNDELIEKAVYMGLQLRYPVADCLYLTLAADRQTPLITADQQMHERGSAVAEVSLLVHRRGGRA